MSLKDKIQDQLVADTDSILEEHLDAVKQLFKLHKDGSIDLSPDARELSPESQMLVYLIANRYAFEGELTDSTDIETEFFYDRFSAKNATIRGYQKRLRDEGFIRKTGKSTHELTLENLPRALERLEERLESSD